MLLLMRLNFQWELVFGSWYFFLGGGEGAGRGRGGEGGKGVGFSLFSYTRRWLLIHS